MSDQTNNEQDTIFLVDDNKTNLSAGKAILKSSYKVYPLLSAEDMFDLLEVVTPGLILMDVDMPGMDGYTALQKLKEDKAHAKIPVIFLTALDGEGNERKGLGLGAVDYVTKPFSSSLLLARIETHLAQHRRQMRTDNFNNELQKMVDVRTGELLALQRSLLGVVADLVEFRDDATGGHISRTQSYLEILCDEIIEEGIYAEEVAKWDKRILVLASPLHDVGKIGIPDAILNKPDKLDEQEFEIIKTHTTLGVEIINRIIREAGVNVLMEQAIIIAGSHHEKWDGSGYPLGLSGEVIPLEGRMMAVADVYDALVSRRPYKLPMDPGVAAGIIEQGSGSHFDPLLVAAFVRAAGKFAQVTRRTYYA
jgi:putative two-component system response regulator